MSTNPNVIKHFVTYGLLVTLSKECLLPRHLLIIATEKFALFHVEVCLWASFFSLLCYWLYSFYLSSYPILLKIDQTFRFLTEEFNQTVVREKICISMFKIKSDWDYLDLCLLSVETRKTHHHIFITLLNLYYVRPEILVSFHFLSQNSSTLTIYFQ